MKTLLLSLTLLALTSCAANSKNETAPKVTTSESAQEAMPATKTPEGPTNSPAQAAKNCICTKIWMPVCGANKKTYGNSCEADCAGVKYTQGACETKGKTK